MRWLVGMFCLPLLAVPQEGPLKALHEPREVHLRNVRQLTFGGQNAEAYWSLDGKKIVFQSMSGDMKADQIYTMDAAGNNKRMVSTGKGRTTCAYWLPNGREIIFASTHGYSPDTPPEPDRSKGYVWPIYPYYTIYRANADGTKLRPLSSVTVEPGKETFYNAEATVAPDGKRIIFTSTRDGDIELYSMNLEGSDVKRLTHTPGYDGGAYYSPDSQMIVWRASRFDTPKELEDYQSLLKQGLVRPSKMEIWIAKADGSEARQVTRNGKANFAPFFTKDGTKIIFASNMDDPRGRKFELYLIGLDGGRIKRVTFGGEFDSFPMFSPDGKRIVWASNRYGIVPHETNIFVADWVP